MYYKDQASENFYDDYFGQGGGGGGGGGGTSTTDFPWYDPRAYKENYWVIGGVSVVVVILIIALIVYLWKRDKESTPELGYSSYYY
ncbi:156L [Cherax quadricarinatus iridovirus]|nr:156L [Cherax quadricarinatus iridovirus]ASZ85136.1 156L [Cherax quadricarinatus iridovirus]